MTRSIDRTTLTFNWPGLHVLSASGKPASATAFKLDWAGLRRHPLVAGAVTAAILGLAPAAALLAYGTTVRQLGWAIVTVACVLGLAYVMNLSGQTITIGAWSPAPVGRWRSARRSSAGSALPSLGRTRRPTRCSAHCR